MLFVCCLFVVRCELVIVLCCELFVGCLLFVVDWFVVVRCCSLRVVVGLGLDVCQLVFVAYSSSMCVVCCLLFVIRYALVVIFVVFCSCLLFVV